MKKVSKKSKRRLMTFGVVSIVGIGYFFVTLFGYLYNYVLLKNEEKSLKYELTSLQKEKENLKIEIQKLNDPEYVARYAKENFLYSSDGEYVLKLDDDEEFVDSEDEKDYTVYIIVSIIIVLTVILLIPKKKKELKK